MVMFHNRCYINNIKTTCNAIWRYVYATNVRRFAIENFFILGLVIFIVTSTFDVVLRFYENVTKRTNDMIY